MTVVLTILSGRGAGRSREITRGGRISIGRSESSLFQIVEEGVSRKHCWVENKGDRVVLRDLGSSNGTYVNGEKVNASLLGSGDEVRLGRAVLKVTLKGKGAGKARKQSSVNLVQEGTADEFRQRVVRIDQTRLMSTLPEMSSEQAVEMLQAHEGLQALYKVGSAISVADDIDQLYEIIVASVLESSGAERAALLIRDADTGTIEPVAVQCVGERSGSSIRVSRTVVDQVLNAGVSAVSNDAVDDPRFKGDSISEQNINAVMCVPVSGKEDVLGALYVDTTLVMRSFGDTDLEILAAIGFQAGVAIERARLVERLESLFIGANRALVAAVEARDPYTHGHSERVTAMGLSLADMLGLSNRECEIVELSGLLHDVGKIGVPEAVLKKAGKLTEEEFDHIRRHSAQGGEIVRNIRHPYIDDVVDAVRHHHERWDGKGYPDGLSGDGICRISRLLAVSDTFDAMTSDRPYRKGMDEGKALSILRDVAGSQLDPDMVEAFLGAFSSGTIQNLTTTESPWKSKYAGTRGIWSIFDSEEQSSPE